MRLPDDEHTGWDRLIAAVLEPDDDSPDATPQAGPDTAAVTDHLPMLDLVALQQRAGSTVGEGPAPTTV